jgi:hypothetical protein
MSYVIKRTDDGKFVATAGSVHSYTNKLQNARTYNTYADANRDRCGNEVILTLDEAMHP